MQTVKKLKLDELAAIGEIPLSEAPFPVARRIAFTISEAMRGVAREGVRNGIPTPLSLSIELSWQHSSNCCRC